MLAKALTDHNILESKVTEFKSDAKEEIEKKFNSISSMKKATL